MRPEKALARGTVLVTAALIAACATNPFLRDRGAGSSDLAVDRAAASAAVLAGYLELLQKLLQSPPAEQAEIVVAAQRDYELTPTPSHQLRYALALAAPGHAGTDLAHAQRLLQELLAMPEMLLPTERALAYLELQKVDHQLTLVAENRRLQNTVAHADRERQAALSRRLQAEIDENIRLRKALDEALAKLDAIANIERSLSERKPNSEGRSP